MGICVGLKKTQKGQRLLGKDSVSRTTYGRMWDAQQPTVHALPRRQKLGCPGERGWYMWVHGIKYRVLLALSSAFLFGYWSQERNRSSATSLTERYRGQTWLYL